MEIGSPTGRVWSKVFKAPIVHAPVDSENEKPWFMIPALVVCGSKTNLVMHWYIDEIPAKLFVSVIYEELISSTRKWLPEVVESASWRMSKNTWHKMATGDMRIMTNQMASVLCLDLGNLEKNCEYVKKNLYAIQGGFSSKTLSRIHNFPPLSRKNTTWPGLSMLRIDVLVTFFLTVLNILLLKSRLSSRKKENATNIVALHCWHDKIMKTH